MQLVHIQGGPTLKRLVAVVKIEECEVSNTLKLT